MMVIQPMLAEEEPTVRDIYAACHPDWPVRAAKWYTVYPTLVMHDGHGQIVGFTSFSVSPAPGGAITLYGNDLCVLPTWRNGGLGLQLAQARAACGRDVGAKTFIGLTQPSNAGMVCIFQRQGFHACQRIPRYFGTEPGIVWSGDL